jgi:hypothetical protein
MPPPLRASHQILRRATTTSSIQSKGPKAALGRLVPRQVMDAGGDEDAASAAIPADPRRRAAPLLAMRA